MARKNQAASQKLYFPLSAANDKLACTPVCICVMVKYIRNCYAHLARPWNFKVSKTAVEAFSNERVFYNVV